MTRYRLIEIEQRGPVRWLWLNRPVVRNAFNDALISEIAEAFADVEASNETRVVVVAARGDVFCAGADLNYMRAMSGYTHAENQTDALRVARMFHAVHSCSRPVLARVHGHAYGGGVGLVAACDIAVASEPAVFALSEVKLGIVAATISPHVVRAMGPRRFAQEYECAFVEQDAALFTFEQINAMSNPNVRPLFGPTGTYEGLRG